MVPQHGRIMQCCLEKTLWRSLDTSRSIVYEIRKYWLNLDKLRADDDGAKGTNSVPPLKITIYDVRAHTI